MKLLIIVFLFCSIPIMADAPILIITHAFNRPEFIELQAKTFDKLLQDDYQFFVFNDADNEYMAQRIQRACDVNGVKCIRIPQEIHTMPYLPREEGPFNIYNYRHVDCLQYSLDLIGFNHNGIVLIIDSDALLIRPFSIQKYMEDKDISARENRPYHGAFYFSPIICFLKMSTLPDKRTLNFNCGKIDGTKLADSGGYTHYYWKKHPDLHIQAVNILYSHQLYLADSHLNIPHNDTITVEEKIAHYKTLGFHDYEIRFLLKKPDTFEFYLDHHFIHFRGGSTVEANNRKKLQLFVELINDALLAN